MSRFAKVSEELIRADLTRNELKVALALLLHADAHGVCWPSGDALADATDLARNKVFVALRGLKEKGIVETLGGSKRRVISPETGLVPKQDQSRKRTSPETGPAWSQNGTTDRSQNGTRSVPETGLQTETKEQTKEHTSRFTDCSVSLDSIKAGAAEGAPRMSRALHEAGLLTWKRLTELRGQEAAPYTRQRRGLYDDAVEGGQSPARILEAVEALSDWHLGKAPPEDYQRTGGRPVGIVSVWRSVLEKPEDHIAAASTTKKHAQARAQRQQVKRYDFADLDERPEDVPDLATLTKRLTEQRRQAG